MTTLTNNINQTIHTPSYNELFKLVQELKERVRILENQPLPRVETEISEVENCVRTTANYLLLPNLDRWVPCFTDYESNMIAGDWI